MGDEARNFEYRLTQTPERRLLAIEFLKKQYHGTESRLQSIYRITLQTEDFMKEDMIIQIGYEPNRIDILTSVTGIPFEVYYS